MLKDMIGTARTALSVLADVDRRPYAVVDYGRDASDWEEMFQLLACGITHCGLRIRRSKRMLTVDLIVDGIDAWGAEIANGERCTADEMFWREADARGHFALVIQAGKSQIGAVLSLDGSPLAVMLMPRTPFVTANRG